MPLHADWLLPDWQVSRVGAVMTTRAGGASAAPFDSFNLRDGLGDAADCVAANRAALAHAVGSPPVFLDQVHGTHVVRLARADALPGARVQRADASFTTAPGVACAVQVADCLPVLFCAPDGRGVAAAHAGWRGLASGVLEATVEALCDAAGCQPSQLQAWLGACIGPQQFEVGRDVLDAFGALGGESALQHFRPHTEGKWLANLPQLARDRLHAVGVRAVSGGAWCTVSDASRFFSYRRDRITGRMAALVWIRR